MKSISIPAQRVTYLLVIIAVAVALAATQSSPWFTNRQSHVENLNSTAINSDGRIVATISGYFENVILKVKNFDNGKQINSTQTEIPMSFYFVWRIKISRDGSRIILLSIQSRQVVILQRNQFGFYVYDSGKVLQFSQQVSLLDSSIDGKVIIVSDYQNFTEVYRQSSGQYELIKTFDTLSDYAQLNISDYFIAHIQISKDPQASTILLANQFFNQLTNQTIFNIMVYVKNAAGNYDYQQSIDLDPSMSNQIYQSRISNDQLTLFMQGTFGIQFYRRTTPTEAFTSMQNISACWSGTLSSAISDDASTLYVLCHLSIKSKALLVYGYKPSLNQYQRIKKIENISAQRFYVSGDGSKIIFANYRNQSLSYASFQCGSGQYFVGGQCQFCTQYLYLIGVCTYDNTTIILATCLTIIPVLLILAAVIVIICIRRKLSAHQEGKATVQNLTMENISYPNLNQPRTFVFQEGQIMQLGHKKRENMECVICEKNGVTHRINCNHMFHNDCIRGWIYRGNDFCPICKESLEMNDVRQASSSSSDSSQNISEDKVKKEDRNKHNKSEIRDSKKESANSDVVVGNKKQRTRKKRPTKQVHIQPNGTTYNEQMLITKNLQ